MTASPRTTPSSVMGCLRAESRSRGRACSASCDKTKVAYPSSTGPTIGRESVGGVSPTIGCEPVGGITKGFVTGIGSSVLHLGCVSLGLMKDRVAPAATFVLMLRLHMLTFGRSALRPRRATRACLHSKRLRTNLEGVNDGTIAESQAHSSTSKYHVIMI